MTEISKIINPAAFRVIVEVTSPAEAIVAQAADASAVLVTDPTVNMSRSAVSRMSDCALIREVMAAVTIPVIAKVRIGHTVEAEILAAMNVDIIDESAVLTRAKVRPIDKRNIATPFLCDATSGDEAEKAIYSGASMIRVGGAGEDIAVGLAQLADVKDRGLDSIPILCGGVGSIPDAALAIRAGATGVILSAEVMAAQDNPRWFARLVAGAVENFDNASVIANLCQGLSEC